MFDGTKLVVSSFSSGTVIVLALASLGIIGLLDYVSGYEISFAVFYLVPVCLTGWYSVRRWAIALAVSSSVVWYLAEIAGGYPYTHPLIPLWNALVRLAFFLIVGLLLLALRKRLLAEREMARTDGLTGLRNRRAFFDRLDHDIGISKRTHTPLALVYVDLDNFKRVNDTYGHGEGDKLLRSIGHTLMSTRRRSDTVARLGGDEFGLILPATDLAGTRTFIRRLEQQLTESGNSTRGTTCSIGAIVFEDPPENTEDALKAADNLMYDAKRSGKSMNVIGLFSNSGVELAPALHVDTA